MNEMDLVATVQHAPKTGVVLFLDHYQYYIIGIGVLIALAYCLYEKYFKKEV